MRIALIAPLVTPISDVHIGGAQAVVADLAAALDAGGHDVTVYASRGSTVRGATMGAVDVDPVALQDDLFHAGAGRASSLAMMDAYRRVYADVRQTGFDVVHNHGFELGSDDRRGRDGGTNPAHAPSPPEAAMAGAINAARADAAVPLWFAAVSRRRPRRGPRASRSMRSCATEFPSTQFHSTPARVQRR